MIIIIHVCISVALKDLLKRSLSENLSFLFRCAIVFARQAALEGRHIHPSYEAWFKVSCYHLSLNTRY